MPVFKLNVVLASLFLISCAAYLAVLNDMAVKGYRLKKIENKVSQVESENKALSLDLAGRQSMEQVLAEARSLGMVDAGSVLYVKGGETAVAKK